MLRAELEELWVTTVHLDAQNTETQWMALMMANQNDALGNNVKVLVSKRTAMQEEIQTLREGYSTMVCMVEGLRRQVGGSTFQEGQSGLALPFGVPSSATTPQLSPAIPSSSSAANTPPTTSRVQLSPALPPPPPAAHTPLTASRVLVPSRPPPHPNSPELPP